MAKCQAPGCKNELTGKQRRWCCDACKMRGNRAENGDSSGESKRNVTVVTFQEGPEAGANGELVNEVKGLRTENAAMREDVAEMRQENAMLRQVMENQTEKIASLHRQNDELRRLVQQVVGMLQTSVATTARAIGPQNNDDLLDTIEIGDWQGDGTALENFLKTLDRLAVVATVDESGPRPMDVPDIETIAEDQNDDLLDLIP